MEFTTNNLAYPLSDTQKELLKKKDDMIDVMSRANLFANDESLHEPSSLDCMIVQAIVEKLAAEC